MESLYNRDSDTKIAIHILEEYLYDNFNNQNRIGFIPDFAGTLPSDSARTNFDLKMVRMTKIIVLLKLVGNVLAVYRHCVNLNTRNGYVWLSTH